MNRFYFVKTDPLEPPIIVRFEETAMNLAGDGKFVLVEIPDHESVSEVQTYSGEFV